MSIANGHEFIPLMDANLHELVLLMAIRAADLNKIENNFLHCSQLTYLQTKSPEISITHGDLVFNLRPKTNVINTAYTIHSYSRYAHHHELSHPCYQQTS